MIRIGVRSSEMAGETSPEEPLSPGARLFHAPGFKCFVIAVMGCKTEINVDVVKDGLRRTLVKHPRFSSIMVVSKDKKCGIEQRWAKTTVDLEDHIIVPDLNPDMDEPNEFLEEYISDLTKTPMDPTKPLWQLHLLNLKTSDANAIGIFKIHHSLGDGVSLLSLVLACTRKTSDPDALPSFPTNNETSRSSSISSSRNDMKFWHLLLAIWWTMRLMWNTLVDLVAFVATMWILKDTNTPIKGEEGVAFNPKRIVYRTVSLDDIKFVKNAMNMTINDVLLGVTEAGLSRYLINRSYDKISANKKSTKDEAAAALPERIRLRAAVLVNVRPSSGIQDLADMMEKGSKVRWGNCIGYILLPFNMSQCDDPLDHLRRAKIAIDRKKHSWEAFCTFGSAKLVLRLFGSKVAASLVQNALFNTTMSFSNIVGPNDEISFYGHPITYIAPTVYGHPHALTVHFQSYMNKMTIVLAVDETVLPDPHRLCDDLRDSLELFKNALSRSS